MLGRGKAQRRFEIGEVRELTQRELVRLKEPKEVLPAIVGKLRDSHRHMAILFAAGFSIQEVAEAVGYSYSRVSILHPTPAFQDLVASFRDDIDEARIQAIQDYERLKLSNKVKAARQLADRLDDADEDEDKALPVPQLVAIQGIGDKGTSVTINNNLSFAEKLDLAVARSKSLKVIEGSVVNSVLAAASQTPKVPRVAAPQVTSPGPEVEQPQPKRRKV